MKDSVNIFKILLILMLLIYRKVLIWFRFIKKFQYYFGDLWLWIHMFLKILLKEVIFI